MKIPDFEIPFDSDGNQVGYYESYRGHTLVPNFSFSDVLKYVGYSRGRSSAVLIFERVSTGTTVEMFMKEFDTAMKNFGMNGNVFQGEFTFCKRGQNFGCRMLSEDSENEPQAEKTGVKDQELASPPPSEAPFICGVCDKVLKREDEYYTVWNPHKDDDSMFLCRSCRDKHCLGKKK